MDGGKCRLGGPPAVESLEDVEPDCACIGYLPANTTWDVPPRAPGPDEPDESHPPIQLERTRRKKAALQGWQDPSPKGPAHSRCHIGNEGLDSAALPSQGLPLLVGVTRASRLTTGSCCRSRVTSPISSLTDTNLPVTRTSVDHLAVHVKHWKKIGVHCVLRLLEQDMERTTPLFASPRSTSMHSSLASNSMPDC